MSVTGPYVFTDLLLGPRPPTPQEGGARPVYSLVPEPRAARTESLSNKRVNISLISLHHLDQQNTEFVPRIFLLNYRLTAASGLPVASGSPSGQWG